MTSYIVVLFATLCGRNYLSNLEFMWNEVQDGGKTRAAHHAAHGVGKGAGHASAQGCEEAISRLPSVRTRIWHGFHHDSFEGMRRKV
jgi:hypothetical protein